MIGASTWALMMSQRAGVSTTPVQIAASRTSVVQREGVAFQPDATSLAAVATAWSLTVDALLSQSEFFWTSGETAGDYPSLASRPEWPFGASSDDGLGPYWGHVYMTVGTHTPTLLIYHAGLGRVATSNGAVTITVTDEETVYAGAATAYWSASNNFTDAPADAVEITGDTPAAAAQAIAFLNTPGRRLMLRGGDTFTQPMEINDYNCRIVGDRSNGKARPIITHGVTPPRDPGYEFETVATSGTTYTIDPPLVALGAGESWRVYLDDTGSATGFTISAEWDEIVFDTAPTAGVVIRIARDPMEGSGGGLGRLVLLNAPQLAVSDGLGFVTISEVSLRGDYDPSRPKTPDTASLSTLENGGVITGIAMSKSVPGVTVHNVDVKGLKDGLLLPHPLGGAVISGFECRDWSNYGIFSEQLTDSAIVGTVLEQRLDAVRSGAQTSFQTQDSPQIARHGPLRSQATQRFGMDRVSLSTRNGWKRPGNPDTEQPTFRSQQSGNARDLKTSISRTVSRGALVFSPQNGDTQIDGTDAVMVLDRVILRCDAFGGGVADSYRCVRARNVLAVVPDDPVLTGTLISRGNVIQPWGLIEDLPGETVFDGVTVIAAGAGDGRSLTLGAPRVLWGGDWKARACDTDQTVQAATLSYQFAPSNDVYSSAKPVVYVGASVDGPMTAYTDGNGVTISGLRADTNGWTVVFEEQPTVGHVIRIAYTDTRPSTGELYPNPLPAFSLPAPTFRNVATHFPLPADWSYAVTEGTPVTATAISGVGDFGEPLAGSPLLGDADTDAPAVRLRSDLRGAVRPSPPARGAFEVGAVPSAWMRPGVAPIVTAEWSATPTEGDVIGGSTPDVSLTPTITRAGLPALTTADLSARIVVNTVVRYDGPLADVTEITLAGNDSLAATVYYGHDVTGRREVVVPTVLVQAAGFSPATLFTSGRAGAWLALDAPGQLENAAGNEPASGDALSLATSATGTIVAFGFGGTWYPNRVVDPRATVYNSVNPNTHLPVPIGPAWTMAAAIRPSAIGSVMSIINGDDAGANRVFQFRIDAAGKLEAFSFIGGSVSGAAVSDSALSVNTTYTAIARRTADTMTLWLDGVKQADEDTGLAAANTRSSAFLSIGRFTTDSVALFSGAIASPVMLTNYAASDAEIADLHTYLSGLGSLT